MRLRKRDLLWLLPAAAVVWVQSTWGSLVRRIKGEPAGPKVGPQAVRDE